MPKDPESNRPRPDASATLLAPEPKFVHCTRCAVTDAGSNPESRRETYLVALAARTAIGVLRESSPGVPSDGETDALFVNVPGTVDVIPISTTTAPFVVSTLQVTIPEASEQVPSVDVTESYRKLDGRSSSKVTGPGAPVAATCTRKVLDTAASKVPVSVWSTA